MSTLAHERTRPVGETTGTAERPSQHLSGPVLSFDLAAEITQLQQETAWREGDRNAITLVKEPDLRVILVAMKDGARLAAHQTAAPIAIQTIVGHLRLRLPDRTLDLPPGWVTSLEANLPHDVEADGESAFLLTMAWPKGASSAETSLPPPRSTMMGERPDPSAESSPLAPASARGGLFVPAQRRQ